MSPLRALFYICLYAFVALGFGYFLAKLFSPLCEYHKVCDLYDPSSYTCNQGPKDYCGKYRELAYGPVEETKN